MFNLQRQKRPVGRLDPWKSVSKILSEDSLSGTEMTKMRKRMRTNTKRVVKKKRIPNRRLSRARKYKETEMATTSIDLRCSESRLGLDNNMQILFGSPGWTYTKPIQSTLVLPDAPLRLDQKANDPETPKTTVLSGNSSSTSVTDVKGNVVKDEEEDLNLQLVAQIVALCPSVWGLGQLTIPLEENPMWRMPPWSDYVAVPYACNPQ